MKRPEGKDRASAIASSGGPNEKYKTDLPAPGGGRWDLALNSWIPTDFNTTTILTFRSFLETDPAKGDEATVLLKNNCSSVESNNSCSFAQIL